MTALPVPELISIADYLAGELVADIKHEYLGGYVYAMVGARNCHNVISGNLFARLHARLRGKGCRPYNSDTKIRIRLPNQTRFYYPDASVICSSNPPDETFQDRPTAVIEVLSQSTRRVDAGEKKDAYFTIPTLAVYLLVEQDRPSVTLFRRTAQGFVPEYYPGLEAVIALPELQIELPLSDVYDGVEFSPESDDEQAAFR